MGGGEVDKGMRQGELSKKELRSTEFWIAEGVNDVLKCVVFIHKTKIQSKFGGTANGFSMDRE